MIFTVDSVNEQKLYKFQDHLCNFHNFPVEPRAAFLHHVEKLRLHLFLLRENISRIKFVFKLLYIKTGCERVRLWVFLECVKAWLSQQLCDGLSIVTALIQQLRAGKPNKARLSVNLTAQ